jgi:FAD/FMN-containing dehydrogenase
VDLEVQRCRDTRLKPVRSAFGDSAWQRLVELKRQWDPDNVFRLNHNIPSA